MSRVPNIFHFVFGLRPQTEPFHLVHFLCLESCRRVNQPEKIYFHYQDEPHGPYWDAIKPHLTLVPVATSAFVEKFQYDDAFVARYRYAHASDFVRMVPLVEHGGVYADIDTIFVNPLPAELWEKPFVLGREPDVYDPKTRRTNRSLCNALMMAEPGASFAKRWRDGMQEAFDGTWSRHSCQLAAELQERHPDEVHVEPQRSFYAYAWSRGGLKALLEECHAETDGIYSVHLWSHLWWERKRKDLSRFHGERLTWRFIAEVDTTYTVLARPFLPAPPPVAEPDPRSWWNRVRGFFQPAGRLEEPGRGRTDKQKLG